jgi:hypothetical protein
MVSGKKKICHKSVSLKLFVTSIKIFFNLNVSLYLPENQTGYVSLLMCPEGTAKSMDLWRGLQQNIICQRQHQQMFHYTEKTSHI